MRRTLFIIIACLLCLPLWAQDNKDAREHIKVLSSPEFHGRGIAYDGETLAAEYLREQLRYIGVEPLCNDYFQGYEMPGFAMEGKVTMQIDGRNLAAGKDFRVLPYSQSLNGEYNIIPVKLSDLMNNEKIEKINTKYAKTLSRSMIYFDGDLSKIKNKKVKNEYQMELLKLHFRGIPFKSAGIIQGVEEMPVWGLSNAISEHGYAYIYASKDKINGKAKKAEISFSNELRKFNHYNVCGIIHGYEKTENFIVIGAHYDHLGAMGDEVYFPGAHDNASGCAMLLSLAQYFTRNPCKHSIVFVFFAGEESGLLGSQFFTQNPPIPLENIDYMINFDLAGGGDDGITLVNSTEDKGLEIFNELSKINEKENLLPKIAQRANVGNSDHYFFTQNKVPAIFVYTMGGQTGKYHDISDTESNCSLTKFDAIKKLFINFIEQ